MYLAAQYCESDGSREHFSPSASSAASVPDPVDRSPACKGPLALSAALRLRLVLCSVQYKRLSAPADTAHLRMLMPYIWPIRLCKNIYSPGFKVFLYPDCAFIFLQPLYVAKKSQGGVNSKFAGQVVKIMLAVQGIRGEWWWGLLIKISPNFLTIKLDTIILGATSPHKNLTLCNVLP